MGSIYGGRLAFLPGSGQVLPPITNRAWASSAGWTQAVARAVENFKRIGIRSSCLKASFSCASTSSTEGYLLLTVIVLFSILHFSILPLA